MSTSVNSESAKPNDTVVVVIVSFRRTEDIVTCLASLQRGSFAAFEVVVVENGGATAFDRLKATLSKTYCAEAAANLGPAPVANPKYAGKTLSRYDRVVFPGGQSVLLIDAGDNLGYAGAINLALSCLSKEQHWRGVWILNPDTQPQDSALQILVSYAENGGFGLVGCRIVDSVSKTIQMRGGARWLRLIGRSTSIGYGEPANSPADTAKIERRLQWISGATTYATRKFIESVGPMNEKYFLYCEDVDWSLRRGQFRLGYAHDAVVVHVGGTTTGSSHILGSRSNLAVYLTERNKLMLTRDHFPLTYPLTVLASCATLIEYLLRGNWRVFVAGWRGWRAGLRGETGRPEHLL
jgi:N-acetylglucosaminyl-diphospho-decaprenol L-rhamnosyltransferase